MTQQDKAEIFQSLHASGRPLILYNAWDAGSARIVAEAGAPAIATGSWSVAAAHGYADGEALPLELALANLRRIVAAVEVPVTIDLEKGYGADPDEVGRSVSKVIEAGAIGCNIEDSRPGGEGVVPMAEQAQRVRGAARAAEEAGMSFFINARVDLFLRTPAGHEDVFDEALERARAYIEAGASGIFLPALAEEGLIGRFCEACPKPVNIMAMPGAPSADRLAALGVARISHGPWPYRNAMKRLEEEARAIYGS